MKWRLSLLLCFAALLGGEQPFYDRTHESKIFGEFRHYRTFLPPPGTEIPAILDCESWSFVYTPDVRYGKELLYQAFQFHKHHLFAWKWTGRS